MSPILELQRRMVEAGRIRAGEKGDKGEPRKLDKWRLTSKDRVRLDAAGELWGGEVRAWNDQWELYTTTDTLPIMLLPGHLPTTWYELWSKGGCQRRCDGQHELISDSSCLCGDERECKPYTRLSVLLPDLPGIGSWLVTSTGWNAAAELAGAADLLQRAAAQGVLIPARLRLEQRTSIREGLTRKFAVPVIDIDTSFRALLGTQSALGTPSRDELPAGYTPIAPSGGNGVSLADGLAQAERASGPGRSAPIPETDVIVEPSPIAVEESGALLSPVAGGDEGSAPASSRQMKPTKRQLDKLNVLVGTLRDGGHISTEQLWSAMATARNVDVDTLVGLYDAAYTPDGVLHWSPLRDSLTREEASALIDRLDKFEANLPKAAV